MLNVEPSASNAGKASDNERELGVLLLHHDTDPVTINNRDSIAKHNPGVAIATISAEASFVDGYSPFLTPQLYNVYLREPKAFNDMLVCSWFIQRREICKKWWIVEWDTYCSMPIREYYRDVWHRPFVASEVYSTKRPVDWHWFHNIKDLPADCQPYAMGAVPFLYLISEEALTAVCEYMIRKPLLVPNNELRFASIANRCGFPPFAFTPPGNQISWIRPASRPIGRGIYHPVKHLVSSPMENRS